MWLFCIQHWCWVFRVNPKPLHDKVLHWRGFGDFVLLCLHWKIVLSDGFSFQNTVQTSNLEWQLSPPPINMCAKCHVLVSIINKECTSLGSIANNSLRTLGLCLPTTIIAIFNGNCWPNDFVVCQLVTTKFDRLPNKLPLMTNLVPSKLLGNQIYLSRINTKCLVGVPS
jgi:hypothetical protein